MGFLKSCAHAFSLIPVYAFSQQAKAKIRQILPVGLSESISKVRSSVAYAVSAIAHWDWPEQWPELFPLLMQGLTSGQPDSVHGAMRVLSGSYRSPPPPHPPTSQYIGHFSKVRIFS